MRLPRGREWRPVLRAGLLVAYLPLLIKRLSLPQLMAALDKQRKKKNYTNYAIAVEQLARISDAIAKRAPHFGIGDCLLRSLLLYKLLVDSSYQPELFIGVNLTDQQLSSHCWVEVAGQPLCESSDPKKIFKIVYRHK